LAGVFFCINESEVFMKKINSDQLTKLLNKSEVINLELGIYDIDIEASFYYKDADIYDVRKKLDLKTF